MKGTLWTMAHVEARNGWMCMEELSVLLGCGIPCEGMLGRWTGI